MDTREGAMTAQHAPVTSSMLGDAIAHHLWATDRLLDACESLSEAQLSSEVAGTYGSIITTFGHMVGTDRWYLGFFPDVARDLEDIGEAEGVPLAQMRVEMHRNADAWRTILLAATDPDADVPELTDEWEFHVPVSFRLAQVVHHGTDHRSQICTALSGLGIEPPKIDVWAYGEATGRSRAVMLQKG
jgi:uncharacterized damage-inducible protein DinB